MPYAQSDVPSRSFLLYAFTARLHRPCGSSSQPMFPSIFLFNYLAEMQRNTHAVLLTERLGQRRRHDLPAQGRGGREVRLALDSAARADHFCCGEKG